MVEFAELNGLKETVKALLGLPMEFTAQRGGPLRRALFAAAKPMRDNAIARAPYATGNLWANIYVYRDRDPKRAGAAERFVIGVRSKRAKYGRTKLNQRLGRVGKNYRTRGDAFYWWFVEYGTEKMSPRPFLRPAFESHKNIAVRIFERELAKGVASAVRRARRAGGGKA